MASHLKVIFTTFVIALEILLSSTLFAQEVPQFDVNSPEYKASLEQWKQKYGAEFLKKKINVPTILARAFDQPVDSPFITMVANQLKNPSLKRISPSDIDRAKKPVVRHLRGSSGVDFAEPEVIKQAFDSMRDDPAKVFAMPEYKKSLELYDEVKKKSMEIVPQAPDLPSCKNDVIKALKTETAREVLFSSVTDTVVFDWLFIRNPTPGDPVEVFGKDVSVHVYTTKPGDDISAAVATQGISCLPYRIRLTDKFAIHMMGTPALKNYDNSKKGVLYEGIKEKLRDFR